jgi:ATP-dependent helicase HrpA
LVERVLSKEFAWLEKDLRGAAAKAALLGGAATGPSWQSQAVEHLRRYVLPGEVTFPLTAAQFESAVAVAKERLPGLATQLEDRLEAILAARAELARRLGERPASTQESRVLNDFSRLPSRPAPAAPHPVAEELAVLLPSTFLQEIPYVQLGHVPRYLKAMLLRVERRAQQPAKDLERSRRVAPFLQALREFQHDASSKDDANRSQAVETLRWMIEEFKVSVFAQELGTAIPASEKRLEAQIQRMKQGIA